MVFPQLLHDDFSTQFSAGGGTGGSKGGQEEPPPREHCARSLNSPNKIGWKVT